MKTYLFLDENVTRTPVSYRNRYGTTSARTSTGPKVFDTSEQDPAIMVGAPYGRVKEQGPGPFDKLAEFLTKNLP